MLRVSPPEALDAPRRDSDRPDLRRLTDQIGRSRALEVGTVVALLWGTMQPLSLLPPLVPAAPKLDEQVAFIDWSSWPGIKAMPKSRTLRHPIHKTSNGGTRRRATLRQFERGCQLRKIGRTTRMAPRWAPSGLVVDSDPKLPASVAPRVPRTPANPAVSALDGSLFKPVEPALVAPPRQVGARTRRRSKVCVIPMPTATDVGTQASTRIPLNALGSLPRSPFAENPWTQNASAEPSSPPKTLGGLPRREPKPCRELSVFDDPEGYLWSQADQQQVVNILDLLLDCGLAHNSGTRYPVVST